MEREIKNLRFFELPPSFEMEVMKKIKRIKRRRKIMKRFVLPLVLIATIAGATLIIFNLSWKKEDAINIAFSGKDSEELEEITNIYTEVISVRNLESENNYLVEFINEENKEFFSF